MAKVTVRQLGLVLYELTKEADKKQQPRILSEFVKYVFQKGMMRQMDRITEHYKIIFDEANETRTLTITSRHELNQTQLKHIEQNYKKKLDCKHIEIESKIDEAVLGGFKIQYGDNVEDATLRRKIMQLEDHLIEHI